MSESMSSPWIRDYLIDVAETHGAQIYNSPVSKGKKRVQLTHFLTYHAESYVWAWISDKDYSVSVRISKDAADAYKNKHTRDIFDCRFFLVFISNYRPIFSPRPLGPNAPGRTPVSHISLEVDHVSSIGIGAHLFGDPRDIESDKDIKEWVLGLREDGGGGNVLKLRKQQQLVQNTKELPAPPAPSPLINDVSVSRHPTMKVAEDVAKPKPERPQDFKRAYAKRWRMIEVNPWKFATKPAVEERSAQTNLNHPPNEPLLDTTGQPQLHQHGSSERPTLPCRTSSRQGTPTDWSLSNRGSPSPRSPDGVGTSALLGGIQQHCDESVLSPTAPLPSDAKGLTVADTTSDTHSLQPPTPAQRIKRLPLPYSSSPPHSSPEPITSSQLLSSPLPPSSSLPPPPSSFPLPMGIRKNFQRKVPHPGLPVPRPDPKQGPAQILVPNSDTSGIGSSQSQSQPFSQSQQQPQLPSYPPVLPSSLAKELGPHDASLPVEDKPVSMSGHTPKTSVESLPVNGDKEGQEITANKHPTKAADASTGKHRSELDRPSVPSASGTEVAGVGKSDTGAKIDKLQSTNTTWVGDEFDKWTGVQDTDEGNTNLDHHENRSGVDSTKAHSTLQASPSRRPSRLAIIQDLSSRKRDAVRFPNHSSTQLSEQRVSQSSMHSLFLDSSEDERTASSQAPKRLASQTEKVHGMLSPAHVSRHDVEAWKEPSFIAKNKRKRKHAAEEELDTPTVRVDKKHRPSAHPETPLLKRARVESPKPSKPLLGKTAIGIFNDKDRQHSGTSTVGKTRLNGQLSSSAAGTTDLVAPSFALQISRPRMAKFGVNFQRITLGGGIPIPRMRPHPDIKRTLLTTGRIRKYKEVEEDGSVYINQ